MKTLNDFNDIRRWTEIGGPAKMVGAIEIPADVEGFHIPESCGPLIRRNPDFRFRFAGKRNQIRWDGRIDPADVGTAPLFEDCLSALGLAPLPNASGEFQLSPGGRPFNLDGRVVSEWLPSIHGWFGNGRRLFSWFEAANANRAKSLQIAIDSSPVVSNTFQAPIVLEVNTREPFEVAHRGISLDRRYCKVHWPTLGGGVVYSPSEFEPDPGWPSAQIVLQSFHGGATAGFGSTIEDCEFSARDSDVEAHIWAEGRVEEGSAIRGCKVGGHNSAPIFADLGGFNGLRIEGNDWSSLNHEGAVFINHRGHRNGQGQLKVYDNFVNTRHGTFFRSTGAGSIDLRSNDFEGCATVVDMCGNNCDVVVDRGQWKPFNNDEGLTPFFILRAKDLNNDLSPTSLVVKDFDPRSNRGKVWVRDEDRLEIEPELGAVGSAGKRFAKLRRFERAITESPNGPNARHLRRNRYHSYSYEGA